MKGGGGTGNISEEKNPIKPCSDISEASNSSRGFSSEANLRRGLGLSWGLLLLTFLKKGAF